MFEENWKVYLIKRKNTMAVLHYRW